MITKAVTILMFFCSIQLISKGQEVREMNSINKKNIIGEWIYESQDTNGCYIYDDYPIKKIYFPDSLNFSLSGINNEVLGEYKLTNDYILLINEKETNRIKISNLSDSTLKIELIIECGFSYPSFKKKK